MGFRLPEGRSPFARWAIAVYLPLMLVALAASPPVGAEQTQTIAIVGGTIIDGSGGAPIHDGTIVIEGSKIAQVGARDKTRYPTSAKVIDASGKYVLPGLIDMHVHY